MKARVSDVWNCQSCQDCWRVSAAEQSVWRRRTERMAPCCSAKLTPTSLWVSGEWALFGSLELSLGHGAPFLGVGSSDLWADLPSRLLGNRLAWSPSRLAWFPSLLFGTRLAWSQSWIFGSLGLPDLQVDSSGVGSPWSQSQLSGNRLALVSESALSVCSFWVSPLCRLFRSQVLLSLNWFSDSVHYKSPVSQLSLSWWERTSWISEPTRTEPVLYGSPLSNPLSDSSHGDLTNPSPSNWLGLLLCVSSFPSLWRFRNC